MIRALAVVCLLSSAAAAGAFGVSNDGEYVMSPSGDVLARLTVHGVELFDVATAKLISARADLADYRGIAVSFDGKRAALRHEKTKEVIVLDVASGKTLRTIAADGELQFLADGRLAVLGEHEVNVDGAVIKIVGAVNLTPDGTAVVVRGSDDRLRVVAAKTGALITSPPVRVKMIERAKSGRWIGLTVHGEHSAIVTWATGDKTVRTLYASAASAHEQDGQDDAGLKTFVLPAPYDVIYTAARSDEHDTTRLRGITLEGKVVYTSKWIGFDAQLEGLARVGDGLVVRSDNCIARLDRDGSPVLGPQLCVAGYQLAIAPDGALVTITPGGTRTYDSTGALIRTQALDREIEARDPATLARLDVKAIERAHKLVGTGEVQISDDGHWMFVEGVASSSIIDLQTWKARTNLEELVGSRDGSRYAVAKNRFKRDSAIEIRSTKDDSLILRLPIEMDSRTRFSDDGTKLALAVLDLHSNDVELRAMLVDIATGNTLFEQRCLRFALSHDGRRIACLDKNIGVYDIATGSKTTIAIEHEVKDLLFSNDDRQLLIGEPTRILTESLR